MAQALDSVIGQSFADFQLIIVNDQGTLEDEVVIEHYAARDSRICLIRNEKNQGLAASLNRAVRAAKANLVIRMDSDDLSEPTRFESLYSHMICNPRISVCGSWVSVINHKGNRIGGWRPPVGDDDIKDQLLFTNPIVHPSVIMRRSILEAVGGYSEEFRLAQDLDLWLRLLSNGAVFANYPKELYRLREHPNRVSNLKRQAQVQFALAARRSFYYRSSGYPLHGPVEGESDAQISLAANLPYYCDPVAFLLLQNPSIATWTNFECFQTTKSILTSRLTRFRRNVFFRIFMRVLILREFKFAFILIAKALNKH